MNNKKALEILYVVSTQAKLTLDEHALCSKAFDLLKQELDKTPEKTEKPKP